MSRDTTVIHDIWNDIKERISEILCFVNREMGCNICYDGIIFYVANITHGDELGVDIPYNPTAIGSYHTHVDGSYELSTTDVREAIRGKERYIFLGNEGEVYGIDLSRYTRMIKRYGRKYGQLAKRLNTKMKSFDR